MHPSQAIVVEYSKTTAGRDGEKERESRELSRSKNHVVSLSHCEMK